MNLNSLLSQVRESYCYMPRPWLCADVIPVFLLAAGVLCSRGWRAQCLATDVSF
jgi:hypothetical protein